MLFFDTATTLLKAVGVKTASNTPLALSDMSPIFHAIDKAGDLRVALSPLKLLWLPNVVRAASFIIHCLSLGNDSPNPLRPRLEDAGSPIPSQAYGTVYFPTTPVSLFKDIAR